MYGTVSVSSYALDAVSNSIFLILSRLDLSYLSLSLSTYVDSFSHLFFASE